MALYNTWEYDGRGRGLKTRTCMTSFMNDPLTVVSKVIEATYQSASSYDATLMERGFLKLGFVE